MYSLYILFIVFVRFDGFNVHTVQLVLLFRQSLTNGGSYTSHSQFSNYVFLIFASPGNPKQHVRLCRDSEDNILEKIHLKQLMFSSLILKGIRATVLC